MKIKNLFFLINNFSTDIQKLDQRNDVDITIGEEKFSQEQVNDYIEKYKKQIDLLQKLADTGNREAKFTLGNILLLTYDPYGENSSQLEKARNYLKESGYADAFWTLANTYNNPVISRPEMLKYLENLRASADLQSPRSKYEYALSLYSFFGDDKKAEILKYLKEANESNYPNALFLSSLLHSQGNLVEKNQEMANFFLTMAAQHDDLPAAKFILALKYLQKSEEIPTPEIYLLLMQAASLGHTYSQKFLEALFNVNNEDFDEIMEESLENHIKNYYGPKTLPILLKFFYDLNYEDKGVEENLVKSVPSDNRAIFLLALKAEKEKTLNKNDLVKIYEKAALSGIKTAWICMGRIELFGYKDEPGDLNKAAEYFSRGVNEGENDGLIGLALVSKNQGNNDFLYYLKNASEKQVPISDLYLLNLKKKISNQPIDIAQESDYLSKKYADNIFNFLQNILNIVEDYNKSPIISSNFIRNAAMGSAESEENSTKENEKKLNTAGEDVAVDVTDNSDIASASQDNSTEVDDSNIQSAGQDVSMEAANNPTIESAGQDIQNNNF